MLIVDVLNLFLIRITILSTMSPRNLHPYPDLKTFVICNNAPTKKPVP